MLHGKRIVLQDSYFFSNNVERKKIYNHSRNAEKRECLLLQHDRCGSLIPKAFGDLYVFQCCYLVLSYKRKCIHLIIIIIDKFLLCC